MNTIRATLAVTSALLLSIVGFIGVELMSAWLHPFPPGVDPSDMEVCRAHVARYPTGVLFLCAVGWWLTVLFSCALAVRWGTNRHPAHGIVVGTLLLALAVCNMSLLPYPAWFWINLLAFPVSCAVGVIWARRSQSSVASPELMDSPR